jgi:WD40 repeat protein
LSAGNSLILTNNGTDHLTLSANGGFTFATKLADGAAYNLTLAATTPAAQPCTSTYGAGVITAANVTSLNVICGLAGGLSTFTGTGSVATGRVGHTTTLLPSGKVLVVGGGAGGGIGALADAELYDPTTGLWSATGPLSAARIAHTATLLPSGLVLVSGGFKTGAVTTELASAELYDPATGQWSATGSLVVARNSHTSTLLPNGKVLISGGTGGAASTELYDPATGKWTVSGSLTVARFGGHTATLLPNGKVLVSGGQGAAPIASAELFDPASGTWTATGSLATARLQHTATLLPNGKVLVSGGSGAGSLASAELYDPATGQWSVTGSLGTARDHHTATLLPSGKVLASGGYIGGVIGAPLDSAELYDPTTGNWLVTGSLVTARYTHTATLLLNGKVLLSFGSGALTNYLSSAEVYF